MDNIVPLYFNSTVQTKKVEAECPNLLKVDLQDIESEGYTVFSSILASFLTEYAETKSCHCRTEIMSTFHCF